MAIDQERLGRIKTSAALPDHLTIVESEISATPETATENKHWSIVSATAEWINDALPPREHLLVDKRTGRGAMDQTGAWLMGGAGGAGKSYSLIGLALAVTSGELWLDTFQPTRKGSALIIAAEDSVDDIRRRVHAIASAMGISPDAAECLHVLAIHDRVTSLVTEKAGAYAASADTQSLCSELASRDAYDLVIVDPYGRIAGVSVDADNAAAAATITALASIATAARGLVLGVTHTSLRARIGAAQGSPEGATGIRGATGQTDYARGVLRLERGDGDLLTLSLAKANHVAPWEPVILRRGERGELHAVPVDELPQPVDRKAKKQTEAREQNRLDDAAAREVIGKHPTATMRQWQAEIMSRRAPCGRPRADAAISRVKLACGAADE